MNYYRTFYSPENVTTIVVGDFDSEDILNRVVEGFSWGDRPHPPEKDFGPDSPVKETVYIENKANINSSFMMFGFLGAMAKDLKILLHLRCLL